MENTRRQMNQKIDERMKTANHHLDYMAFGLSSLREENEDGVIECLRRGIDVRIITVDPSSQALEDTDRFEGKKQGYTAETICDLKEWAEKLNHNDYRGKVIVQYSSFAPREFYCRVDDTVFIGPYRYHKTSQMVITFEYQNPGDAFQNYTDYFDSLWNNNEYSMPGLSPEN